MRLRLIPWLILFVGVVTLLASAGLFYFARQSVETNLELQLAQWTDNILVEIAKDPGLFQRDPKHFLFAADSNRLVAAGVLVEFLDRRGKLLANSPGLTTERLFYSADEDGVIKDIELTDGGKLKVYQEKIEIEGQDLGSVVVGAPLARYYQLFDRLTAFGAVILLGVFIVMAFGINVFVNAGLLSNQKRFLSFASHELRTPLAVISGNAEVALRGDGLNQEARSALLAIKDEAVEMNDLVANLLQFFRHDSGGQKLKRVRINLGELLAESGAALKRTFPGKKITLKLAEEAEFNGDPDQLNLLVKNLLENAARHTREAGSIVIELLSRPRDFLIRIGDDGTGIAPDDLPKIFNAFYQSGGRTGLGLAIAKWAAEAHGGLITVKSALGRGSVFSVILPKR